MEIRKVALHKLLASSMWVQAKCIYWLLKIGDDSVLDSRERRALGIDRPERERPDREPRYRENS